MKKFFSVLAILLGASLVLSACSLHTFSPPVQIRDDPSNHASSPAIAMDAAGRSHIASVVNDRIFYYRTILGAPEAQLTMSMTGSGAGWAQYAPDVAVRDDGTAYVVWMEERGGTEHYACYQVIPLTAPAGGYNRSCLALDNGFTAAGQVMAASNQDAVYGLFGKVDASGRLDSIWYRELTDPGNLGKIFDFALNSQSGLVHSWDAGVDLDGYLHVAFLYNDGHGPTPYTDHLRYTSNRSVSLSTMAQIWHLGATNDWQQGTAVKLAFSEPIGGETVNFVAVMDTGGKDEMILASCLTNGCGSQATNSVPLPASWSSVSDIREVGLHENDDKVVLGFIGNDGTTANDQVYILGNPLSGYAPTMLSDDRPTHKRSIDIDRAISVPGSFLIETIVVSWGETDLVTMQYYTHDTHTLVKVYDAPCNVWLQGGEAVANGVHFAGVWEACNETWFAALANLIQLPIVTK